LKILSFRNKTLVLRQNIILITNN